MQTVALEDLELVARLCDLPHSTVSRVFDTLSAGGLITSGDDDGEHVMGIPWLAEALYAALGPATRDRIHRSAADALSSRSAARPGLVAHHLLHSSPTADPQETAATADGRGCVDRVGAGHLGPVLPPCAGDHRGSARAHRGADGAARTGLSAGGAARGSSRRRPHLAGRVGHPLLCGLPLAAPGGHRGDEGHVGGRRGGEHPALQRHGRDRRAPGRSGGLPVRRFRTRRGGRRSGTPRPQARWPSTPSAARSTC